MKALLAVVAVAAALCTVMGGELPESLKGVKWVDCDVGPLTISRPENWGERVPPKAESPNVIFYASGPAGEEMLVQVMESKELRELPERNRVETFVQNAVNKPLIEGIHFREKMTTVKPGAPKITGFIMSADVEGVDGSGPTRNISFSAPVGTKVYVVMCRTAPAKFNDALDAFIVVLQNVTLCAQRPGWKDAVN